MKLLMIASGYLPYQFSENLCNAKLVYALYDAGIQVDVISKIDMGPSYGSTWKEPWLPLQSSAYEISYCPGSIKARIYDILYSGIKMGGHFHNGIRWARRAYEKALFLYEKNHYDAILTRSPNDIAHLVGYKLKHKLHIKWIANWNDPADPIWPAPYKHKYNVFTQKYKELHTLKLLSNADINTFPAESLRQHFINHFPVLTNLKTEVIPHIGLTEKFCTTRPFQKRDKLYMCHSGNMSAERNPELTFRAIRMLIDAGYSRIQLDIMGKTSEFTDNLIRKYSLTEYVKIIGNFDYFDAISHLNDYDVLVLLEAQLDYGIFFASKLTDYAQTGRPIFAISPENGFAKETINQYNAGIVVNNNDVESIKEGLKRLILLWEKGELYKLSSNNLYKQFSPNTVVNQYKQIIQEIS